MAENKHIPSDLHPSILEKLPSKSLLKFLSVSESWYSLIKNPKFIASHLHHHKSLSRHPNNHLLLLRSSLTYYLYRYDNPFPRRTKIPNPPEEFKDVVASYDGLVCLSDSMAGLMLWNPSINKFRCIEPKPIMYTHEHVADEYVVGFGYNSLQENYKVVLINYHKMSIEGLYAVPTHLPCAHVYSINRGGKGEGMSLGWNQVFLPELFSFALSRISECCFVNGMIHWIVFHGNFDDESLIKEKSTSIMTFDPKSDCFGEIKLPTVITEEVDPRLELAVIGDSLAVVQLLGDEKPMDNVLVWRMEEYAVDESWKVLYRIKLCSATKKEVWAKEDGKVIITTSSGTLIVFNVNRRNNSGVFDGARGMTGGKAYGCTESLLLLDA